MRSPYERQPRHSPPPDDRDVWMARLDPTGETACDDIMRDQRQQQNNSNNSNNYGNNNKPSALRGASSFRRTDR